MKNQSNIVVAWNGLPAYGARLIRAGRDRLNYDFPVIATRPNVPIKGMEEILGGNLTWVDPGSKPSWESLQIPVPKLFIHTGWGYPVFLSLANEVRGNSGKVVGMFDNCWKGNFRQYLGGLYFRLFRRRQYAAAWVPGRNAKKLAKYIGFSSDRIFEGMYGADPIIFGNHRLINERPRQIIFVGRLNSRKGVSELAFAFNSIRTDFPDWRLKLIGEGPLADEISPNEQVEILPFAQPSIIARHLNESRVFALPSREEHWGLVVHEAALCGCVLALRALVGSTADLANSANSVLFEETSPIEISECLREVMQWSDEQLRNGNKESCRLASGFGPEQWANTLEKIVETIDYES